MNRVFFFTGLLAIMLFGLCFTSFNTEALVENELPPRPPTATPVPPTGGLIVLRVEATSPVPEGLWTVVQWQDANGDWHDVEGWQGNFNEKLEVVWWVAPEDLDKGPFHWVIYETQGSEATMAISDSFYLPRSNRVVTEVVMLLS